MNPLPEPEVVLHNGLPIRWQIRDQIVSCIRAGLLRPGDQLPTVRALAVGLAVNPNSVSEAYAELERAGMLTAEEGSGTFVASSPAVPDPGPEPAVERLCAEFLAQAACLGHPAAEALRTLEAFIQRRAHP